MKAFCRFWIILALAGGFSVSAQTNLATIATDGAWTWFNDPRALFHNGTLYVGYVRNGDSHSTLTAFNPQTGVVTSLWSSSWTERDDHDNPGLCRLLDGRLLAIYARHGSASSFSYRLSLTTNPVAPADWGAELTFTNTTANITYSNPYQLSSEPGRIFDFMRNLNFNPTYTISTNGGTNWAAAHLLIKTGTGSTRPYVKYASDGTSRIEFLYTDAHPDEVVSNSLYHAYYQAGGLYMTDGTFLTNLTDAPLLHDSGQRGSVIYQYSGLPSADYNEHIPNARSWCAEITYQGNGDPACVFWTQLPNVTGTNWFDDRIYYYYARWTGTNWQKRFIAQGGRPLYDTQVRYAGGIALDPEDANTIYLSTDAVNPFDVSTLTNVPLAAHFEIFKGVTTDGGLNFTWSQVTSNSTVDNLRPYVPRNRRGVPVVLWFRGTYTAYTAFNTSVVGLFTNRVPAAPRVSILSPANSFTVVTNLANKLKLLASASDDGLSGPLTTAWSTITGPTNAVFGDTASTNTSVSFPLPGLYSLRLTASNSALSGSAALSVQAGSSDSQPDASLAMWLKFDESAGSSAADSSGNANNGALAGSTVWRPTGGMRAGALQFNGTNTEVVVLDANNLDNTSALTLAYWFRADAFAVDSGGLVCKRDSATANNAFTTYLKRPDQHIYVDLDNSNDRFASVTAISTGVWYHVALVFDGSLPTAQRAKLWINGLLDVTAGETSAAIPNYTSNLRVGNTHTNAANWFSGLIDDVRLYRRALSAAEVGVLAATNAAPSVSCGPPPSATNAIPAPLIGNAFDDGRGGPLTLSWTQTSGPGVASFASTNSGSTSVTFNQPGLYRLRLNATDTQAEVFDEISVTVAPNPNLFADWISIAFPAQTNVLIVGPGRRPRRRRRGQFNRVRSGHEPNHHRRGALWTRTSRPPDGRDSKFQRHELPDFDRPAPHRTPGHRLRGGSLPTWFRGPRYRRRVPPSPTATEPRSSVSMTLSRLAMPPPASSASRSRCSKRSMHRTAAVAEPSRSSFRDEEFRDHFDAL